MAQSVEDKNKYNTQKKSSYMEIIDDKDLFFPFDIMFFLFSQRQQIKTCLFGFDGRYLISTNNPNAQQNHLHFTTNVLCSLLVEPSSLLASQV